MAWRRVLLGTVPLLDGRPAHHPVAYDHGDAFSQFRRVDGALLPRGAAANDNQFVMLISHDFTCSAPNVAMFAVTVGSASSSNASRLPS